MARKKGAHYSKIKYDKIKVIQVSYGGQNQFHAKNWNPNMQADNHISR